MAPYTDKGYTGQYNDALTGLDYYNARYYDPTVGVFLSADTVQGNAQGMNPYAYVGGNPETMTDPTGKYYAGHNGESGYVVQDSNGDGGETLYTYVQGWQTTYHYNPQHQVDSVNGSPENRSKVARTCGIFCGAVKDQGVEIQGRSDIVVGAIEATVGIATLAQLGTLAATWLAGGLSDMLYGLRTLATNHTEVNPHFLFGLDAAKFFVDTVQVILLLFNIGHLVTNSGPGRGLLNKAGYIGGTIKGWFTGQPETMKTLIATTSSLMSNVIQLTSPQSGAAMPLIADYNNLVSDAQAAQSYDNASD